MIQLAIDIATYLPEGIFGLIIVLLLGAVVALWKKLDERDKEIKNLHLEYRQQLNAKDIILQDSLTRVLEGLKESNEIVHKVTTNIGEMTKPVREDIMDHDQKVYKLMTEIKSTIQTLTRG